MIHMNGRVYDYNLGRFASVDPFIQAPGNSQSMNPYSYILNNPLAGRDPTGYVAEEEGDSSATISRNYEVTTGSKIRQHVSTTLTGTSIENGVKVTATVTVTANGAITGTVQRGAGQPTSFSGSFTPRRNVELEGHSGFGVVASGSSKRSFSDSIIESVVGFLTPTALTNFLDDRSGPCTANCIDPVIVAQFSDITQAGLGAGTTGKLVGLATIGSLRGAAKSGDNFVVGYRAVSKAEADDIAKHGFRPYPNGLSMQDKWFSETRAGAEKFKQIYSDLDSVVKIKVPKDVYYRSFKHSNIDNTGPGFCVACDDLSRLK